MSFVALGTALGVSAGAAAFGTGALAIGAAGTIAGINASNKAASAAGDAIASQKELIGNLKYQPIDIAKLQADTSAQALQNATQSLANERALTPELAASREQLAKTISSQLALGGKLSPDIANQVTAATRVQGSISGAPATPLTGAAIGQTAQGLQQQRIANASTYLAANPLQPSGLDPGALASAEVANNSAMNQFNLEKAGVSSNLVDSTAKAAGAAAGGQAGNTASILNFVKTLPGLIPSGAPAPAPVSPLPSGAAVQAANPFNYKINSGGFSPLT